MSFTIYSILTLLLVLPIFAGIAGTADARTITETDTSWTQRAVELQNGLTLSYVEQGSASGIPVVLLHGWTDSWNSFKRVLPHLPESMHVFAPSLRGHGDSDKPVEGYNPEDFAVDIADFMDAVGLDSAIFAGFSMGAVVAQQFTIDNPERVQGLLLTGTPANLKDKPGISELWELLLTLEDPIDPDFVREFNEGVPVKPVPAEFLETINRENLKVPAHVWTAAFKGVWEADFMEELSGIEVPVLILWGDREVFTTVHDQEAIVSALPDVRLKVYAGNGHALHWEDPELFAADLTRLVESIHTRNK